MDFEIGGRRVFITAGASGIGMEMAVAFDRAAAKVHVCDIDAEALRALASRLPSIGVHQCDVADRDAVARTMSSVLAGLGGLDVLINNAGVGGATSPMETLDPSSWKQVLETNLTGMFHVTQLAIPHLKQNKTGVIINMSALAGRLGYPNRSAYSTSKWGVVGLTKTLAMELGGDGIRVNAILPGAVDGQRFRRVLEDRAIASGRSVEEESAAAMKNMSIKSLVQPHQLAALAMFLVSDAAATISGQIIAMDGDTQSIA